MVLGRVGFRILNILLGLFFFIFGFGFFFKCVRDRGSDGGGGVFLFCCLMCRRFYGSRGLIF